MLQCAIYNVNSQCLKQFISPPMVQIGQCRFFTVWNVSVVEIYTHIREAYGFNAMIDCKVRKWERADGKEMSMMNCDQVDH